MKSLRFNSGSRVRNENLLPYILLLFAIIVLVPAGACSRKTEQPAVLKRQGWVSDYAAILQPEEKKRLAAMLESYEKETCHQIYLLIVPSLAGENFTEFSQRTATAWKIGQPGLGNGLLLSIAMQEGSVRIESGPYFEWFIKEGAAEKVLKDVVIPLFQQGRFVEGIEQGLQAIMAEGRLKPVPEDHKPGSCG